MDSPTSPIACQTCSAPLAGKYCSQCGEKVLDPAHDLKISKFIEQAVDGFTHLDSKIWLTFKLLFFKPGMLSAEYLAGRRVKYMKPIQLVLVSCLLFFFFMPHSGSFYTSYEQLETGFRKQGFSLDNPVKYDIQTVLQEKARKRLGPDATETAVKEQAQAIYRVAYERAAVYSKTYLILLLPVWAFLIYLLFLRSNSRFVPHLVFAAHLFSFFLLLDLMFLLFYFELLQLPVIETFKHLLPFLLIVLVYFVLAVKRFYQQSPLQVLWKGTVIFFLLLMLIGFFRVFVTIWAVQSM